jgi:hypothetical protein
MLEEWDRVAWIGFIWLTAGTSGGTVSILYWTFVFHKKKNSVAWVRERTMSTERPSLAGEVSANIFADRWRRVVSVTDSYGRILGFLDQSRYFFLLSSSSVVLTRLSEPRSQTTTSVTIWYRRESNPDRWICSQELWSLDHRGGQLSST